MSQLSTEQLQEAVFTLYGQAAQVQASINAILDELQSRMGQQAFQTFLAGV
jgi:hypothetical protein